VAAGRSQKKPGRFQNGTRTSAAVARSQEDPKMVLELVLTLQGARKITADCHRLIAINIAIDSVV